ncbi:hypothetical protein CSOJ01_09862 [Colletotrichum sojae]|uniref:LysM domain-containing protein n=1 Tax=Colletotrichum sojae TaxID=2175907 RepID=A0A8H6J2F2_9PEZI|nr:hypothetical protein CSOJ01_09862 [Colletotrichum sojae]
MRTSSPTFSRPFWALIIPFIVHLTSPFHIGDTGSVRLGTRQDGPGLSLTKATCRYIKVNSGDGCASLVSRCKISAQDFTKFNPKKDLCSTLKEGDYVCCSAGEPYKEPKPDPPKPQADGTCATHVIKKGDSCATLGEKHGITVENIEEWNRGKTWA